MFLVTTALEDFWDKSQKILFLGEWCKLYKRKEEWEKLDYKMLPYHWDNRPAFYRDYLYMKEVYEKYIRCLSYKLNEVHNVDFSLNYWRIIIGPWLYYFIQIFYDRYLSIKTAADSGLVTNTWITRTDKVNFIPNDFPEFAVSFTNDSYNHYIYSYLIEILGNIQFEFIEHDLSIYKKKKVKTKDIIKHILAFPGKYLPSNNNRYVIAESFSLLDMIKLNYFLGQYPYIEAPADNTSKFPLNFQLRKNLFLKIGNTQFESILDKLILNQIPKAYIEGYRHLANHSLRFFPKKPKLIFTAAAHESNECFKFWAAYKKESGTKLVISQHGGHYGTGLFSRREDHEIGISDYYFSWGWQDNEKPKVVPIASGTLWKLMRERKRCLSGHILWAAMSVPRYFYLMHSFVVGPQWLRYLDEQKRFSEAVLPDVHELLLLRPSPDDWDLNQLARWKDIDPRLKLYFGKESMLKQVQKSRLFIATYNGTTYLQTFVLNHPTVIFWNPNHWELREDAQPYFDELRHVGILHDTPESAASKVNEIYHNPDLWWQQAEIQHAKNRFSERFAKTSNSWMDDLAKMFKKITGNDVCSPQ
jgi:putative transferase (TIGR04331 family)